MLEVPAVSKLPHASPRFTGVQSFTLKSTVTTPSFSLSAGAHTVKLVDESQGFNINDFDLTS